jgi:hypothetical protein
LGPPACRPRHHLRQSSTGIGTSRLFSMTGQGLAVRSSERPASSRDHWAMGRPLIRVTWSETLTPHCCGQPGGSPPTVPGVRTRSGP